MPLKLWVFCVRNIAQLIHLCSELTDRCLPLALTSTESACYSIWIESNPNESKWNMVQFTFYIVRSFVRSKKVESKIFWFPQYTTNNVDRKAKKTKSDFGTKNCRVQTSEPRTALICKLNRFSLFNPIRKSWRIRPMTRFEKRWKSGNQKAIFYRFFVILLKRYSINVSLIRISFLYRDT